MSVKLSPVLQSQIFDANGNPLSGGKIETYLAGSTTPAITYSDSNGTIPQSNPIILNTRGETNNLIWLTEGVLYKFIVKDSLNKIVGHTYDNIQGINDSSVDTSQWQSSNATPTYISATQFSLAGDQTSAFEFNRRVKITVTAGTVYGYISVSAYTVLTTVTVVLDSGVLDTGISSVELGLLTPSNPAYPNTLLEKTDSASNAQYEAGAATDLFLNPAVARARNLVQGTQVATTSGTSVEITTTVPLWAKVIYVEVEGVSTNGASPPLFQIGDAGGFEVTGYLGSTVDVAGATAANATTGIQVSTAVNASSIIHGTLILTLKDASTNTWTAIGMFGRSDAAQVYLSASSKALSAALDRIRITTVGGANTFDAGSINVLYG